MNEIAVEAGFSKGALYWNEPDAVSEELFGQIAVLIEDGMTLRAMERL